MSGRVVCSRFRKQQLLPVVTCLLMAFGFLMLPVSCNGRAAKLQQLLQADDSAGTVAALGDDTSPLRAETRRKLLLRGMGMARAGGFRSASGLRQRLGSATRPAGMPGYMPPAQARSSMASRKLPGRSTTPFAGRWRPAALDKPSQFRSGGAGVGAAASSTARRHRVSSLLPLVAGAHMFRGAHSRDKQQPQKEDPDRQQQLQQAAEGGPGKLNRRPVALDARTAKHPDEKAAHEKLHRASNDMRNRVLGKPVVNPENLEESGTE